MEGVLQQQLGTVNMFSYYNSRNAQQLKRDKEGLQKMQNYYRVMQNKYEETHNDFKKIQNILKSCIFFNLGLLLLYLRAVVL